MSVYIIISMTLELHILQENTTNRAERKLYEKYKFSQLIGV